MEVPVRCQSVDCGHSHSEQQIVDHGSSFASDIAQDELARRAPSFDKKASIASYDHDHVSPTRFLFCAVEQTCNSDLETIAASKFERFERSVAVERLERFEPHLLRVSKTSSKIRASTNTTHEHELMGASRG
jgi:hypothetical protein